MELNAHKQITDNRDAVIEQVEYLIRSCWNPHKGLNSEQQASNETVEYLINKVVALKSQPAQPDPKDEALKVARQALQDSIDKLRCTESWLWEDLVEALAAIDAVLPKE